MDLHSGRRSDQQARAFGSLDGSVELLSAELIEVRLPFREPVATAKGTHRMRPLVLVHLQCTGPDGSVVDGWGECAALGDTTYDDEDVAAVWSALTDGLIPGLISLLGSDGKLPTPSDLHGNRSQAGRPMAYAALEMAVADGHLRAGGRSFADLIGVGGQIIEPGAVLGLPTTAEQLGSDLVRLLDSGYARVKIKIAPGLETLIDGAVRPLVGSGIIVQLDANGTYGSDAAERLGILDDLDLACIEQPLGRYDLEGHRQLAADLVTPICLDESLDSPQAVVEAVDGGACSVVCVKPARLGGIGSALEVINWCEAHSVPWWIGGMFESGYARGVNRALSALSDGSLPGDLAPPQAYLDADLVEPMPGTVDADSGRLTVPVPVGPGMGPVPDPPLVEPRVVRRLVVDVRGAGTHSVEFPDFRNLL